MTDNTPAPTPRPAFRAGEPAPMFSCRTATNDAYQFDTVGGRYVVLSFLGSSQPAQPAELLHLVQGELRHRFNDTFLAFYGVTIDPADAGRLREDIPGIRYFFDLDRKVSRLYGAEASQEGEHVRYRPLTLVLDPLLRVLANIPWTDAATHNARLREVLAALPPLPRDEPAPVLVLPRVFDPELCRELIDLYRVQGGRDSNFMRQVGDKTVPVLDHSFKRRADFFFEDEPEFAGLRSRIDGMLTRRLVPEVQKSFQFAITRIERYLVACYDAAAGGFFRPHRDNKTLGTAHRKFACTINLNADEYEGGDLRFPEFSSRSYRAPTGGAVVFSCSLLHEAQPVTRGTRYALLPFFYDDAGAELRRRNAQFVSDELVDLNQPAARARTGAATPRGTSSGKGRAKA